MIFLKKTLIFKKNRNFQARDLIRLMQVDQIKDLEEAVELFK